MDTLREALKELREEQDLCFGYEGHPTDPRDEKFALGYLYKAVVLAIEKEEENHD